MTDERALSVSINYTLSLVIVTMLFAGLFVATSGYVDVQRERAISSEFQVVGNRMAADLSAADRVVATVGDASPEVEILGSAPAQAAGSEYRIEISVVDEGDHYNVTMELISTRYSVNETVTVKTDTAVEETTVSGGDYEIVYDSGELEVRSRG